MTQLNARRRSALGARMPLATTLTCMGMEHRVLVRGGAVTPLDHPDLKAEYALVALGAERPPCLGFLHAVATEELDRDSAYRHRRTEAKTWAPSRQFPDALGRQLWTAAVKRFNRAQNATIDPYGLPPRDRWEALLRAEAESALDQCSYRAPFQSATGLTRTRLLFSWDCEEPVISGALSPSSPWGGMPELFVTVEIGRRWAYVHHRGLAVVDRKMVLDIIEDGRQPVVIAGRQYQNFEIRACRAQITRGRRLRWLS